MRGELLEARRVHSIVGAFFEVYNYFGFGLSESIYSRALEFELIDRGHLVAREVAVEIYYKGRRVGRQRLDMLVDEAIIVENKATATLPPDARPRLLSYLKATWFEVGLLLHFGPEPKFQRLVDSGPKSFAAIRASFASQSHGNRDWRFTSRGARQRREQVFAEDGSKQGRHRQLNANAAKTRE